MPELLHSERIIKQIQGGNELAFETLFFAYYDQLYKYAWKYVRSKQGAKGIVQDVFADVWQNRNNLDEAKNIKGFLFALVKNRALDIIKHQKIVEKHEGEVFAVQESWYRSTEQHHRPTAETFINEDICRAIEDLPPRARQIFLLNREEGLTYKEIAAYLNISVKTVESQMSRVLKLLRKSLRNLSVS
jgi:RNA polymerase sigma-70 factor (ECF subfamily)